MFFNLLGSGLNFQEEKFGFNMMEPNEEIIEATVAIGAPIDQLQHQIYFAQTYGNNVNFMNAGADFNINYVNAPADINVNFMNAGANFNGSGDIAMEGGEGASTNDMGRYDDGLVGDGIFEVNNSVPIYPSNAAAPSYVPRYSTKVFMGGLPHDVNLPAIYATFKSCGSLMIDWPRKIGRKLTPPKGFAYLIFDDERSVQKAIDACIEEDGKYFSMIPSSNMGGRMIEIRPWLLSDSHYVFAPDMPYNPRNTIFLGGVPRMCTASELATNMSNMFGPVYSVGIDTDIQYKYPLGSALVCFVNRQSYIDALATRFIQLTTKECTRRVEARAYILKNQACNYCMQNGWPPVAAPYFCANATCMQYFCVNCWIGVHAQSGCTFHKPWVKGYPNEPMEIPYQWD